eukprot:10188263-Prorocentrum_lima.AAC.1
MTACLPLREAALGLPNYPALAASQFVTAQAGVAVAAQKQLALDPAMFQTAYPHLKPVFEG